MKLAWATDIHLNFLDPRKRAAFARSVRDTGASALLITGDIAEGPSVVPLLRELHEALGLQIFYVLGNHDYYRSSIGDVRAQMEALCSGSPGLSWLHAAAVTALCESTALVGVDGWADGQYGDYHASPVSLNDYVLIRDLALRRKGSRLRVMRELASESAERLRGALERALPVYPRVLVATHVPPFEEACWHEGKISGPDWLPHFACKATGDVLLGAAEAWPDRRIEVLCGHTHSEGVASPRPNLLVRTGAADYGAPALAGVLEIEA
ncbi:metallophosphoesterase family protein [Sorangium sp. So ce1097]|uniref:metallophosphoesterase family protein n=1 Tax=Sorangium sp. So ce1097 TaxID=3133330 RepID=UPI003F5EE045